MTNMRIGGFFSNFSMIITCPFLCFGDFLVSHITSSNAVNALLYNVDQEALSLSVGGVGGCCSSENELNGLNNLEN